MKNIVKFLGIIVFVTIIGFTMTACPDGSGDDSGSGGGGGGGGGGGVVNLPGTTWKRTNADPILGTATYTLTFTDSEVELKEATAGVTSKTSKGTYTLNGSTVTVTWTYGKTGSETFSVNGNTLTVSNNGNKFTKQ
jgi:hypothetical protein